MQEQGLVRAITGAVDPQLLQRCCRPASSVSAMSAGADSAAGAHSSWLSGPSGSLLVSWSPPWTLRPLERVSSAPPPVHRTGVLLAGPPRSPDTTLDRAARDCPIETLPG